MALKRGIFWYFKICYIYMWFWLSRYISFYFNRTMKKLHNCYVLLFSAYCNAVTLSLSFFVATLHYIVTSMLHCNAPIIFLECPSKWHPFYHVFNFWIIGPILIKINEKKVYFFQSIKALILLALYSVGLLTNFIYWFYWLWYFLLFFSPKSK